MKQVSVSDSDIIILDILWEKGDMTASNLYKILMEQVGWSKSTTYTVLKKLCEKGIFKNENAVVSSRIKKDQFYAKQSRSFVEDTFGGSLPKFLTEFIGEKRLSDRQAEELKKLIDQHKEG